LRPDLYLRDLHVVGFSLGAQVAGHVGRLMNSTIQRITGMYELYYFLFSLDGEGSYFLLVPIIDYIIINVSIYIHKYN